MTADPLRIDEGGFREAIAWDADVLPFAATSSATASVPAAGARATARRSATVEVRARLLDPGCWALIGGVRTPSPGDRLIVTVPTSGEYGRRAEQRVGLLGLPLTAALSDDLAAPAVAGLLWNSTGAGDLRVTSAGYDEVSSSPVAMLTAARVLSIVLHGSGAQLSELEESWVRRELRSVFG